MKIASFCIPHVGGTYTVARGLRNGLHAHGIEMRWIGVGAVGKRAYNDPAFTEDRSFGEVVAPDTNDEAVQAEALRTRLVEGAFDGVLIDVLGGKLQANIARYLPPSIIRILIVHSISIGTYAYASAVREWVHHAVGVSTRIRDDLINGYRFPRERIECIPNAVDLRAYRALPVRQPSAVLRVIVLGRVEDASKGIFWLPEILRHAATARMRITVAGDGPDLPRLKSICSGVQESVDFLGTVAASQVPNLLACHDVLLMPSRYEGFGLTLIEAMAAGCVPVASRIKGVTDFIVESGKTGVLFPVGDTRQAGGILRQLNDDCKALATMSDTAQKSVQGRFTLERQVAAYAEIFQRTTRNPPTIAAPLPIDQWVYPKGIAPGWRSWVPERLKPFLRRLRS